MEKTICLDMDGTFVHLYGVRNWKRLLELHSPAPYVLARPLVNLSLLARQLNRLQKNGYKIVIISWLARNSDANYDRLVAWAKRKWLNEHLPSVKFDEVIIVPYGTPKHTLIAEKGILFDDEKPNVNAWVESGRGRAYTPDLMFETLKTILERGVK